jgi:hypothetical protein
LKKTEQIIIKRKALFLLFLLTGIFTGPTILYAQDGEKPFRQDDVFSVFTKKKNKAKRDSLSMVPVVLKKPYFAITPFIGYNPAYGALIGVGSTIATYLGNMETTPVSSAAVSINLTSKSQVIFNLRTNIFTPDSKFILRGDWRYMIFSQPTYGLGTGLKLSNDGSIILDDGGQTASFSALEQPINYNYIRLYETFYIRIIKKWYAGFGYSLDIFSEIVDHKLRLDTVPKQITSQYRYNSDHGFNLQHQTMSGVNLEILLDTRDNSIRPTRGYFANIVFRPNFTFLGSSKNSLMLNTEFRTYIRLSKRRPDHLIGFWYLGQFTEKGTVPYLGLPAIGWDMYNRSGRGNVQGSIRGVDFLYGETEYRFPISPLTGILGGVIFVNATTANSDDTSRKLFEYIDPAAGLGLRIMFSRRTLSNLSIDFGIGTSGSVAITFNLNEAF